MTTAHAGTPQLVARWIVVLSSSLALACGGRSCGSTTAQNGAAVASPVPPGSAAATSARQHLNDQLMARVLGGPDQPRLQIATRIDGVLEALKDVRSRINRTTFDPGSVVTAVGSDPVGLQAWVRDNTGLVPYKGVLRGPIGVLMDRVGNSLDRSLLLAELLRRAGHEARLARGTLSDDSSRELLKGLKVPALSLSAGSADLQTLAMEQIAKRVGGDAGALQGLVQEWRTLAEVEERAAVQRASTQAAVLTEILKGTLDQSTDVSDELLPALMDHWWVQVRRGSQWSDLDPSLPSQGRVGLTPVATFKASEIPDDLYHTVRIRVQVERLQGSNLETSMVLEHTVRTADVAGVPIKLAQVPARLSADFTRPPSQGMTAAQARQLLATQAEWVPILTVGAKRFAQSQFSLSGEIKPAGASSKGPSQLGGGLFGALGGGDEPNGGPLAAEYLEYELVAPGGVSRTERRTLFDWVEAAARTAGGAIAGTAIRTPIEPGFHLAREASMLVLGSHVSGEFVEHSLLGELIEKGSLVSTSMRDTAAATDAVSRALKRTDAPVEARLLELALARSLFLGSDVTTFINRSNVLTLHRGLMPPTDSTLPVWQSYDIVANDVEVLAGTNAKTARLRQGVVDGNAESIVAGPGAAVPGVSELMGAGRMTSDKWVVVTKAAEIPANLPLAADAKARLMTGFERGLVAVLPSGGADLTATSIGWWEVDLATGRTMAIDSRGWGGQALVEVTVTEVIAYLISMSLAFGCFYNAIANMATNTAGANACAFASCTVDLVMLHLGFFKVAVSAVVGPMIGGASFWCPKLFPPPGKT